MNVLEKEFKSAQNVEPQFSKTQSSTQTSAQNSDTEGLKAQNSETEGLISQNTEAQHAKAHNTEVCDCLEGEECTCHDDEQDLECHHQTFDDELIYCATQILSALADSTRFKILLSLSRGEKCVCDLEQVCSVSQSAISHQLRLLRDRNIVVFRREGQRVVYSLADNHVRLLIDQAIAHAQHSKAGM